ncbi:PLAC8 family-domain-containing protein [Russula vinacea]|nr:PLAC8 family-domain-containing protein [Russula vinacea]
MDENQYVISVTSQPQGTAPMHVGGNKNAKNREIGADGMRNWSFGLFSCFVDCGFYCQAFWCPCVARGKTKQRIRHLQVHGTPLPPGGSVPGIGLIYSIEGVRNRTEIRERYGIRGHMSSDFFITFCCDSCAATQERREIELEEASFQK